LSGNSIEIDLIETILNPKLESSLKEYFVKEDFSQDCHNFVHKVYGVE
jgi:hypothetical protein